MTPDIRCKRIIDGKTYNTETATLVWHVGDDADGPPGEVALFKTRHGAYFLYYVSDLGPDEGIRPMDPSDALAWLEKHCWRAEVIEAEFGEMPEAGDAEARITLRVPETLRRRIASLARERSQSLNAWIVRCLEACSSREAAPAELAAKPRAAARRRPRAR
jgi:hypothetical protein